MLTNHTVRLGKMPRAHEKCNKKEATPPQNSTATAGNGDAQVLMGQLAPLLERWLWAQLAPLGVTSGPRSPGGSGTAPTPQTDNPKIRPARQPEGREVCTGSIKGPHKDHCKGTGKNGSLHHGAESGIMERSDREEDREGIPTADYTSAPKGQVRNSGACQGGGSQCMAGGRQQKGAEKEDGRH